MSIKEKWTFFRKCVVGKWIVENVGENKNLNVCHIFPNFDPKIPRIQGGPVINEGKVEIVFPPAPLYEFARKSGAFEPWYRFNWVKKKIFFFFF